MGVTSPQSSPARSVPKAASIITLVVGGFVLTGGWILGIPAFQSFVPGLPKMVANTALAFILTGISLSLLRIEQRGRQARRIGQVCAIGVVLIGSLTLSEYLFGWNLAIDQLIFKDIPGALQTSIPGRPSPQTSVDFVLIGSALLLLNLKTKHEYHPTHILAIVAGLVALLAVLGYFYGVAPLYSTSPYTGMSIPTATLFIVLSLGILCSRPESGLVAIAFSDSAGGLMVRRLLPAALVIPSVIGWLISRGLQISLYELNFGVSVFVLSNVIIFGLVIWWNAALLHRVDRERQLAGEEIRRLNHDLSVHTVELEAANRELEAFSYSVSHDLSAPLRALDGFSAILLDEHADQLNPDGRALLQRVGAACQRMKQLIDALLQLSHMTRMQMRHEQVNLSELVREIATNLQEMQPDRKAEFIIQEGITAQGDARLLRVALENLLNNAWKYTRKQENTRIEFGSRQHSDQQVRYVRDNGVGFDMKYANNLFGAFQRLHSENDFEGTGIGLATVQRIILRHGGRIWVEAAVNEGATFYFTC